MTNDNERHSRGADAPVIYPDIAKILNGLAAGTLEVHCSSITLTQCVSENPETFRGKGSIRLLSMDSFQLQMHVDSGAKTDPLARFKEMTSGVSGTLVPESEYYTLTATDYDGVEWFADPFLIKKRGWTPTFITASFGELKHRRSISTSMPPAV